MRTSLSDLLSLKVSTILVVFSRLSPYPFLPGVVKPPVMVCEKVFARESAMEPVEDVVVDWLEDEAEFSDIEVEAEEEGVPVDEDDEEAEVDPLLSPLLDEEPLEVVLSLLEESSDDLFVRVQVPTVSFTVVPWWS